jgi:hypothetical protein
MSRAIGRRFEGMFSGSSDVGVNCDATPSIDGVGITADTAVGVSGRAHHDIKIEGEQE